MTTIQIADKPTLDAVRSLLENSGGKRVPEYKISWIPHHTNRDYC